MEKINHPEHYKKLGKKECIVQMEEDYGVRVVAIFCLTNAYKYLYRAGAKLDNPAVQDINKAKWYFDWVKKHSFIPSSGNDYKLYTDIERALKDYD